MESDHVASTNINQLPDDITKTRLFKYIDNSATKKWKLSDEICWQFSYFYSKQDCGYL